MVLNTLKGKLYNIEREIRELEEKTKRDVVRRRVEGECRMLANDIEEIRVESVKLEERRKLLEGRIVKLQGKGRVLLEEEKFLTSQIESIHLEFTIDAENVRRKLGERIEKLETLQRYEANDLGTASQLSMSKVNASAIQEHKRSYILPKSLAARRDEDFWLVKERYEKRIKLIEGRLDQLRSGKTSPRHSGRAVRRMNSVEEVFRASVARAREEILRRKVELSETINTSLKVSKSLPEIPLRSSQPIPLDANLISLRDFTETDKM